MQMSFFANGEFAINDGSKRDTNSLRHWPTHQRIPRVRRLEYIVAFLRGLEAGYAPDAIKERVLESYIQVQEDKAEALGRHQPKPIKVVHLVANCQQMCLQLGLAIKQNDRLVLTTGGQKLLADSKIGEQTRAFLLERLWLAYPDFGYLVLKIAAENGVVVLPMKRGGGIFAEAAKSCYNLSIDHMKFEIIRDIATQLQLLNWRSHRDDQQRLQKVYSIARVVRSSDLVTFVEHGLPTSECPPLVRSWLISVATDLGLLPLEETAVPKTVSPTDVLCQLALKQNYLVFRDRNGYVFAKNSDATREELERALWEEYLKRTDYVPRFPVLYAELRDDVCERLRISDNVLEEMVLQIIQNPDRLRIFPSGGIAGSVSNLAHMLKNLPPRMDSGDYITYLKIDKV